MEGAKELLEKCTEMVVAVEELSVKIPKIQQSFDECKQLKKELSGIAEGNKHALDEIFKSNKIKVDKIMKNMEEVIEKYEKICSVLVGSGDVLEKICNNYEKILQLDKRMDKIESAFNKEEAYSLKEIIDKYKYQFPLDVHRDTWTSDFHFIISEIVDEYAKGNTYVGNKLCTENARYRLSTKSFSKYVPSVK